jgi:hypothetical protein
VLLRGSATSGATSAGRTTALGVAPDR